MLAKAGLIRRTRPFTPAERGLRSRWRPERRTESIGNGLFRRRRIDPTRHPDQNQ